MAADDEVISDYEDLTEYFLDDDELQEVVRTARECVINWSTKDGWPVGVVNSYVPADDGHIWLTCARRRKRVAAIKRDNRVSVVISSLGSELGGGRTVTFKGTCWVHDHDDPDWDVVKTWFYRALATRFNSDELAAANFMRFLDSPGRVILEVTPTWKLTYDGRKMGAATARALATGG
jgi:general stress protein 26